MGMYTDEYLEVYDVVEVDDCGFSHYLHHFEEFAEGLVFEMPGEDEMKLFEESGF